MKNAGSVASSRCRMSFGRSHGEGAAVAELKLGDRTELGTRSFLKEVEQPCDRPAEHHGIASDKPGIGDSSPKHVDNRLVVPRMPEGLEMTSEHVDRERRPARRDEPAST